MRNLVENAQQGKMVALKELYEVNLTRIYTLISRLTGNKFIAEQLTKTILLRAWKIISENGTGGMRFSDWIKELSLIVTVGELRDPTFINDKRFKKYLEKNTHHTDYSSDPIEELITELDLDHRITFVLNKIENYNLVQISNFMGEDESELETILSEAIEKISEAMSEADTELDLRENWINLQEVIVPDEKILKDVLEEIKEIRVAEIKEKDAIEAEIKKKDAIEKEERARRKKENKKLERANKKHNKEKTKAEKAAKEWRVYKPTFQFNKKLVMIVVIPVIIFIGIQLAPSSTDWSVTIEAGTPLINNEPFSSVVELSDGDIITTDSMSTAKIGIPQVGEISVLESTKFKRLEETNSGELLKGKVSIIAGSSENTLNIKIPEVNIENYGQTTSYSIETDHRGNSHIELENGWLKVYSEKDQVVIAPNYKLNVYKRSGASIPYHTQSKFEYIAILDDYLFGGKRDVALNHLLSLSSKNEIITVWNLLFRVNAGPQAENVYDKLYELAPHSDQIKKADILLLDSRILHQWLEEIKAQI
jgi:RNA polymerase sigma-70 factor (ECF subfamily)